LAIIWHNLPLLDVTQLARLSELVGLMESAVQLQQLDPAQGFPVTNSTATAVGEWLSLSVGCVDWQVKSEFANVLENRAILEQLRVAESGEVIKTGVHRTVFRRELPSGVVFVKHFRIAGWRSLAQNLVRPCKAELESRAVRRVAEIGIPTADVLAIGRVWHNGMVRDNYLVTRDLVASQLDQFLQRQSPGTGEEHLQFRTRLAEALGRVAGRLHAAGIEHTDFHPGNILIRGDGAEPEDQPQLWLIDLHAARSRGTWSLGWAARSLAALNQFFQHRASRTDQLRFFHAYRGALAESGIAATWDKSEFLRFAVLCQSATAMLWDRADRAWRRGNRHQRKLKGPRSTGRALAVLDRPWVEQTVERPESLFGENVREWCKNTGKRRVARIELSVGNAANTIAFAKSVETRGSQRFLSRWRTSRVRRAWEIGHAFLRRGLPTPKPLLFLVEQGADLDRQYLVTEAVPQSQTLAQFSRTVWPTLTSLEQRAWISPVSQRLARLVRRMHDCRYDHRDLKFENLLVANEPASVRSTRETSLWFLDLDAVHRWTVLLRARRVQNLSRVNVSATHLLAVGLTDRLRFLRSYLGSEFSEWKTWWRQVARKSQQKTLQNESRGRRLS